MAVGGGYIATGYIAGSYADRIQGRTQGIQWNAVQVTVEHFHEAIACDCMHRIPRDR